MRPSRWAISRSAPALARRSAFRSAGAPATRRGSASAPVVADGRVFTIDTTSTVRAFDAPERRRGVGDPVRHRDAAISASLYGGGVAVEGGRVYRDQRARLRRGARCDQRRHRVERPPGRPVARRPVGRRRHALCDQPGQSDLFAEDGRRRDQLVERRQPRDRRRVRVGLARGRPGDDRRRLLVGRTQRLSLREWPAGVAGRSCRGPACRPAWRRCRTSTPIR